MLSPSFDVCALGNAIVDIVADVPELFLSQQHITKNTVTMVDHTRITLLRKSIKGARAVRAGGAAANTVASVASLGGKAAYMGKIGYDEVGHLFSEDLQKLGVKFPTSPTTHESVPTGICLSFVTTGATRTMCTYLGASVEFGPNDIDLNVLRAAQITYLEGYMLDRSSSKLALYAAADNARAAGRKVGLALCDPTCVDRNRKDFTDLIREKTDIIFANEKELMALYKTFNLDTAIAEVKGHVNTAVVTRSEKGAIIVQGDRQHAINAEPVAHVVDKTGAGDAFAAGYLYGLARRFDPHLCGRLGAIAASEVISHYGPRPEHSLAAIAKQKGARL
jgi:sugar/nucleoside kinase (ribokinase family)